MPDTPDEWAPDHAEAVARDAPTVRCACGSLSLDTAVSERPDREFHGLARCAGWRPA